MTFRMSLLVLSVALAMMMPLALSGPAAAQASTDVVSLAADRDTEVRADKPDSSYGSRLVLGVDGQPVRQSYLRFTLSGLSDREVTAVRLRLFQSDSSRTGGTVSSMSSTSWPETSTWRTRPNIDGPQLATFDAVSSGQWYELELPVSSIGGEGPVSFAITSPSSDGVLWSSRESANPPVLLVELAPQAPPPSNPPAERMLTQVADPSEASSSPTYYSSSHRLAPTSGDRLLAVYGRHATGVQLSWRDRGSADWSRSTTGEVTDGVLLGGTGTGDWPASVTTATRSDGQQVAVVVWSGPNFGATRPLQMRVLTNLDAPDGPRVGPTVTLAAPALGAARADVGYEMGADGEPRLLVTWSERTAETTYQLKVAWLDDIAAPQPALFSQRVLLQDTSAARTSTVVPTAQGARVAARADSGRLRVYGHEQTEPLTQWWTSGAGPVTPTGAYPSAVGLPSGDVLVAAATDVTQGGGTVARFTGAAVAPTIETQLLGLDGPVIAADAGGTWLVGVRRADGYVVSRSSSAQSGWSDQDVIEIGAEGGGNHSWPSVLSTGGRRHLVVRGPGSSIQRSSVLSLESGIPGL